MFSSKFIGWLKVAISIACVILILLGFLLGYVYNNYSNGACKDTPLSYGIEKLNDMNDDSFTCACTSLSGEINPFYFDKSGTFEGTFLDSQITIIP